MLHLKPSQHFHKHAQQSQIILNVMATTCVNSNDQLTATILANHCRQNQNRGEIKRD